MPRESQLTQDWMEQHCSRTEKRQREIRLSSECRSPGAVHLALLLTQGDHPHTLLLFCRGRTPFPSHQEPTEQWGWRGAISCTPFKQNKEVYSKPRTGKDTSRQVHCPAQDVRAPYLHVRKCSRPMAHSYTVMRGSRGCVQLPFATFALSFI